MYNNPRSATGVVQVALFTKTNTIISLFLSLASTTRSLLSLFYLENRTEVVYIYICIYSLGCLFFSAIFSFPSLVVLVLPSLYFCALYCFLLTFSYLYCDVLGLLFLTAPLKYSSFIAQSTIFNCNDAQYSMNNLTGK